MPNTVEITKEEYLELVTSQAFLECLRHQGVDNWDGYDHACEEFSEWEAPV